MRIAIAATTMTMPRTLNMDGLGDSGQSPMGAKDGQEFSWGDRFWHGGLGRETLHLIHTNSGICTCVHRYAIRNVCPTDERAVSRKRITGRAEEHSSRRKSEVLIRSRSREDR